MTDDQKAIVALTARANHLEQANGILSARVAELEAQLRMDVIICKQCKVAK